jgi:hypothetical protein
VSQREPLPEAGPAAKPTKAAAKPAKPNNAAKPRKPGKPAAVVAAAWAVAGRIRCWPSETPVSLHAWLCDCGEYGVTDSQPESRRAVEAHLAQTEHAHGEYYYGCQGQRTTVTVTPRQHGGFSHELTSQ